MLLLATVASAATLDLHAVDVSVGPTWACARASDGRVACWGQLPGGAPDSRARVTTAPPGASWSTTAGDDHQGCTATPEGRVLCWGANHYGQLGDGLPLFEPAPTRTEVPNARQLATTGDATCVEDVGGERWCWGDDSGTPKLATPFPVLPTATDRVGNACVADRQGPTLCRFRGGSGELERLGGLHAAVELVPLHAGVCGRDGNGDVACWIDDRALPEQRSTPFAPRARTVRALDGAVELAAGTDFLCARTARGEVRCLQLPNVSSTVPPPGPGVDVASQRETSVPPGAWSSSATPVPELRGATRLSATDDNLCAVVHEAVRCTDGPVDLPGAAVDVAAGRDHACALLRDGTVWCWGADTRGQLGHGRRGHSARPVLVAGIGDVPFPGAPD